MQHHQRHISRIQAALLAALFVVLSLAPAAHHHVSAAAPASSLQGWAAAAGHPAPLNLRPSAQHRGVVPEHCTLCTLRDLQRVPGTLDAVPDLSQESFSILCPSVTDLLVRDLLLTPFGRAPPVLAS
jgi:hypothetical protein